MFLVRVCDIVYNQDPTYQAILDLDEYKLSGKGVSITKIGSWATGYAIIDLRKNLRGCSSIEEIKIKCDLLGIQHQCT